MRTLYVARPGLAPEAADVLVRPFSSSELLARVRSLRHFFPGILNRSSSTGMLTSHLEMVISATGVPFSDCFIVNGIDQTVDRPIVRQVGRDRRLVRRPASTSDAVRTSRPVSTSR